MRSDLLTRRDFSVGLALFSGLSVAGTALGSTASSHSSHAGVTGSDEVSHSGEAVHQEIVFKPSRKRVYEALTDSRQFNKVVLLSAAMKDGMPPGAAPTEISREVGGAFSIFGGHIVGRHIELVRDERIVQAWRVLDWDPGIYSLVKFELIGQGSGTKLVLDHTGFPKAQGQHLADGWKEHYWEPLAKYLAQ